MREGELDSPDIGAPNVLQERILNLGCGWKPLSGAINHDRWCWADYIDVAHDLNLIPWPWRDNSFDRLIANSVVEHLDSFYGFFDEAWRILAPEGRLEVIVPRYDHVNVAIDPTHKRGYHVQSFHFLDPATEWGRKAVMYSTRRWRIVSLEDLGTDIRCHLEPRK